MLTFHDHKTTLRRKHNIWRPHAASRIKKKKSVPYRLAYLVSEHGGQEVHHDGVLAGELHAQGADGLHHHDLELVRDLRHERADLLHQPVHRALTARLQWDTKK